MIGNDIIDRQAAQRESNWQRKGFLAKLFTAAEQLLIQDAVDPEQCVWELWSRKEAAYKVYHRQSKIRAFIPLQLECSPTTKGPEGQSGTVSCRGNTYHTTTLIMPDYIHTIAVTDHRLRHGLEINICRFADLHLRPVYRKDKYGIPYLSGAASSGLPYLSVSHHGKFWSSIATAPLVQQ